MTAKKSDTLTKIRFLFELPNELKAKIEVRDLAGAVADYEQAAAVLDNYKEHPSFESIQKEVTEALDLLIQKLYEPFEEITEDQTDVSVLVESVDLLVKLDLEVKQLSKTFLDKSIKPTEQVGFRQFLFLIVETSKIECFLSVKLLSKSVKVDSISRDE